MKVVVGEDGYITLHADRVPLDCYHFEVEVESPLGEDGHRVLKVYPDRIEVHTFVGDRVLDQRAYELPDYFSLKAEDSAARAEAMSDLLEDR